MKLLIKSPFEDISKSIASIREQKGKEKDAHLWIDEAINFGKGFIVSLLFERILVYQHLVMQEDSKPTGKRNMSKRRIALANMKAATITAQKFVENNNLKVWQSRAYRFLGRLSDYEGKFAKSIEFYEKAIKLANLDPEFTEKGIPRHLELKAFLAFSLAMSGNIKDGIAQSNRLFKEFNSGLDGIALKKSDYYTWTIWKSGIVIRLAKALTDKKMIFNKKQLFLWIEEVEKDLNPSKTFKSWGDFSLRKDELNAVKRSLQETN